MNDILLALSHAVPHMRIYHRDRLSMAYQILGGIPDDLIKLDDWVTKMGLGPSCGTIACGGGWLAQHPYFKELGLMLQKDWGNSFSPVLIDSVGDVVKEQGYALASIFMRRKLGRHSEIGPWISHLFASATNGGWDEYLRSQIRDKSEKALVLARFKYAHDHFSK